MEKGLKHSDLKMQKKLDLQSGGPLMPYGTGTGKDDKTTARHGDVIISNNRAYLYYFTHPGRIGDGKDKDGYEQHHSSKQVVELDKKAGKAQPDNLLIAR